MELLKRNRKQESVDVQKTRYVLVELSEQIICPMVEKLSAKINKFNTLFMHSYYEIFINDNYVESMYLKGIFDDYFKLNNSFDSIGIEINFKGYKNAGLNVFDISKKVTFSFQTYKYSLLFPIYIDYF
jgi:predicted translin family RNA/ssDNA-binding protein